MVASGHISAQKTRTYDTRLHLSPLSEPTGIRVGCRRSSWRASGECGRARENNIGGSKRTEGDDVQCAELERAGWTECLAAKDRFLFRHHHWVQRRLDRLPGGA